MDHLTFSLTVFLQSESCGTLMLVRSCTVNMPVHISLVPKRIQYSCITSINNFYRLQ